MQVKSTSQLKTVILGKMFVRTLEKHCTQAAIAYSKLTIETLEQVVKHVQS